MLDAKMLSLNEAIMEAKGENPEDDPTRVEIRQDTEEAIGSINQVPAKY